MDPVPTTLLSATVLLFLVMDPIGNIPLFVSALKDSPKERRHRIILRESFFAFLVLAFFLFFGRFFLELLHLSMSTLRLSGGIILFLIALKLIFPPPKGQQMFGDTPEGEPLFFPLAVPLIAGPSAAATIMVLAASNPPRPFLWLLALVLAMSAGTIVLYFADGIQRIVGRRALIAVERLMGLLLTGIAVQMIVEGVREVIRS